MTVIKALMLTPLLWGNNYSWYCFFLSEVDTIFLKLIYSKGPPKVCNCIKFMIFLQNTMIPAYTMKYGPPLINSNLIIGFPIYIFSHFPPLMATILNTLVMGCDIQLSISQTFLGRFPLWLGSLESGRWLVKNSENGIWYIYMWSR